MKSGTGLDRRWLEMIEVKRIGEHSLPLPSRASHGAAGFDLMAADGVTVYRGGRVMIATGFAWDIPDGYVGMIRPRSGLAVKHGIDVLAGVIDSDYRGEVKVVLINHGERAVDFQQGDRVAQMVIQPVVITEIEEVSELDDTERGGGGFGSTGA